METLPTATAAGGTHPTGMHSSLNGIFIVKMGALPKV